VVTHNATNFAMLVVGISIIELTFPVGLLHADHVIGGRPSRLRELAE
jgi:hypothetical protein